MNLSLNLYTSYIWLLAVGVLSIACEKEPVSSPTQLIKINQELYFPSQHFSRSTQPPLFYQKVTYYYANTIQITYQYDVLGRIIEQKHVNPDFPTGGAELGNESTQYTYVDDKINCVNSLTGSYSLPINKSGYVIWDDPDIAYSYDRDGYLLRKKTPYVTLVRTIDDQNITEEVIQEPTGMSTSTYEYSSDHLSLTNPLAIFKEGKTSRNLLIKATTVYEPILADSYKVTKTYSYQFDERDRVSQQMVLQVNTVVGYEPTLTVNRFTYSN